MSWTGSAQGGTQRRGVVVELRGFSREGFACVVGVLQASPLPLLLLLPLLLRARGAGVHLAFCFACLLSAPLWRRWWRAHLAAAAAAALRAASWLACDWEGGMPGWGLQQSPNPLPFHVPAHARMHTHLHGACRVFACVCVPAPCCCSSVRRTCVAAAAILCVCASVLLWCVELWCACGRMRIVCVRAAVHTTSGVCWGLFAVRSLPAAGPLPARVRLTRWVSSTSVGRVVCGVPSPHSRIALAIRATCIVWRRQPFVIPQAPASCAAFVCSSGRWTGGAAHAAALCPPSSSAAVRIDSGQLPAFWGVCVYVCARAYCVCACSWHVQCVHVHAFCSRPSRDGACAV
jgi:hypothetical protein